MKLAARHCWLGLEIAVLTFLSWFFLAALNIDMDEMQIAYPLGCAVSPLVAKDPFREGCGIYDLMPPAWLGDAHLPLRVADYVGSIQTLLYWPFWMLIPGAISVRIFRMALFWLIAAVLARICKAPRGLVLYSMAVIMPLCFVAIAFAVSEILLCIAGFFLILHTVDSGMSRRQAVSRAAGLGLCLAAGVMMRLNFLLYVPGLLIGMLLFLLLSRRLTFRAAIALTTVCVLTFSTVSALFLGCRSLRYGPFINILEPGLPKSDADRHLATILHRGGEIFSQPLLVARYHKVLNLQDGAAEAVTILLSLLLFLGISYWGSSRQVILREQLPWFVTSIVGLVCTLGSPAVTGWHHVTPALTGAFLALAYAFARSVQTSPGRVRLALLGAIFVASTFASTNLYAKVAHAATREHANRELPAWTDTLVRQYGRSHLIVVLDWGAYYFLLGSGEKELMLYWTWYLDDLVPKVKSESRQTGRPILFVYRNGLAAENVTILQRELGDFRLVSRIQGSQWNAAEVARQPQQTLNKKEIDLQ